MTASNEENACKVPGGTSNGKIKGDVVARYSVDTKKVKRTFIVICALLGPAFALCSAWGGHDWDVLVLHSLAVSTGLFGFLWLYGCHGMFGFEYCVTTEGVTATQWGSVRKHLSWSEIRWIGYEYILARRWRIMHLALPPPERKQAMSVIREEWKKRRSGQWPDSRR